MTTNIWSDSEVIKFYENVICFDKNERDLQACDFFCIAARKKYMTAEQREAINLGDTCMMQKTLIKDYDSVDFLNKLKQVDATLDYLLDRDNKYIPRSCMAVYSNINHVDMFKSMRQFRYLLADRAYELSSLMRDCDDFKKRNLSNQIKSVQNYLLKTFQDPKNGIKNWFDIDCDIDEESDYFEKTSQIDRLNSLKNALEKTLNSTISPYVIKTRGGCHVLINNKSIKEHNSNLAKTYTGKELGEKAMSAPKLLDIVSDFFKDAKTKEIKINQNAGVPTPGTIQGGFKVRMY
nr:MAG TPA: hypothetical protein [Bacteriophage sp.]